MRDATILDDGSLRLTVAGRQARKSPTLHRQPLFSAHKWHLGHVDFWPRAPPRALCVGCAHWWESARGIIHGADHFRFPARAA